MTMANVELNGTGINRARSAMRAANLDEPEVSYGNDKPSIRVVFHRPVSLVREVQLAARAVDDLLKVVAPSTDLRYAYMQTIETDTFLATLAQASTNSATVVCVGQEGTSIDVVDHIVADRLASRSFPDTELNQYTGKLYKIDLDGLFIQMGLPGAPKPASVLRAAKQKLAAMADRPILLLDHIEALEEHGEGRDPKDIEELKSEIAARGPVLAFGIFHAPDSENEYLTAARLGYGTVTVMPFKPYNHRETGALIDRFYVPIWKTEGRGFSFARDAFDLLIKLEPGAWHDQRHSVLPGLVIDITQDAMQTALHGEAAILETASRARDALARVRLEELPRANSRATFEPLLKRAEEEITELISPKRGLFGIIIAPTPITQDPNKPILITSGHIVAELFCPNRSEFHFPGFVPDAVRGKVEEISPASNLVDR
jgi:hypothetical protein